MTELPVDKTNELPHQSLKDKRYARLAYIALGIITIPCAIMLYWLFTGSNALTITQNIAVQPAVVTAQGNVTLTVSYCKYTDDDGRTIRRFVSNSTEIFAPTINDEFEKGCHNNQKITIPIPDQTPPGDYHVNYRITYHTNPFKTAVEDFNSGTFTVVNSDDPRLQQNTN